MKGFNKGFVAFVEDVWMITTTFNIIYSLVEGRFVSVVLFSVMLMILAMVSRFGRIKESESLSHDDKNRYRLYYRGSIVALVIILIVTFCARFYFHF